MSKHTPEPWAYEYESEANGYFYEWYGIGPTQYPIGSISKPRVGDDGLAEANARRIVACVNACAGIETHKLESSTVFEMMDDAFDAGRG